MKTVAPNAAGLDEAAGIIRAGGVVAYPTETVYGLAANPFSSQAVQRIFTAKGRPAAQPVLLIVADRRQLREVAAEVPPKAELCMEAFWPGPLTLLFPKAAALAPEVTAGSPFVAVRHTAHPVAQALCQAVGHGVTSTSANLSGEAPASSLESLPPLPGVALALDGGALPPSPPSTLYDPVAGRVLREGAVPGDALAAVTGGA